MSSVIQKTPFGAYKVKFGPSSYISGDSAEERLQSAMRLIIRQEGVSGLLDALKVDINKRHPEDQELVWKRLLPVAEEVIWGMYARKDESLLVFSNIPPWVELGDPYEPMITARINSQPPAFIEWNIDPQRNISVGWDREVQR
ncbi:hypothetical protein [Paenibacillus sp. NPDC058177]|uniref:hypothetical protein n=1 Tax=Paenibacillus sp. NPDC058177 TaxID=3346369 RepID=UPI0036DAFD2F